MRWLGGLVLIYTLTTVFACEPSSAEGPPIGGDAGIAGDKGAALDGGSSSGGGDASDGGNSNGSDASDGGDASDGSIVLEQGTVDDAIRHFGAYCDYLERCKPAYVRAGYGDLKTCRARFAILASYLGKQGGNAFTPATVDKCVASFESAACDAPPPSCELHGSLANDAGCNEDSQCQSGYCSTVATSSTPGCRGACRSRVLENGSCHYAECAPGLFCDDSWVCRKEGAVGADCGGNSDCQPALRCGLESRKCEVAPPKIPTHGVCTLLTMRDCREAEGEACLVGDGGMTGTCAPMSWAEPGSPCGLVSGFEITQCRAGFCKIPAGGTKGTCVGWLADGASCDPAIKPPDGPACLLYSKCDVTTRTCAPVEGEVCPANL